MTSAVLRTEGEGGMGVGQDVTSSDRLREWDSDKREGVLRFKIFADVIYAYAYSTLNYSK